MKIGLIVPGFSTSESDWCIPALLDMVRGLAQHHEIHVFTLRYPYRRRVYPVYSATVHALGGGTTAGVGRIGLLRRAVIEIMREHRRAPFDVLHGLWADEPGFAAVIAAKLLRIPAVVSLLGGELVSLPEIGYGHQLSRSARWMIRHSLRAAQHVTVGSAFLRDITPVEPQRLRVIPLGVDTELFSPEGESRPDLRGGLTLLHAASLTPIKNQAMLLHTVAQVSKVIPDTRLHIVGDGVLRPSLEKLARDLGVNATFHGDIPHDQLPAYYRSADVCLVTSFYESQSMVALEAAACGKLTVGTRVGILPELVAPELLVESGEVEKLARILIHLAQGQRIVHVQERIIPYALENTLREWESLYREMATKKPR